MPRRPMPPGTYGKIKTTLIGPKKHEASAWYRDGAGDLRRMRRMGTSATGAENNLKEAFLELASQINQGTVNGDTRVRRAAELWLKELDQHVDHGDLSHKTVGNYRSKLNNYILPNVGSLTLRELHTGRCDELLKNLKRKHGVSTARFARLTLTGLFGYAIRNGLPGPNPTEGVEDIRGGSKPPPRALEKGQRADLVKKLRKYCEGKKVDKRGRARGSNAHIWNILPDIVDAMLSTGGRIGEVICVVGDDIQPKNKSVRLATHWGHVPGVGRTRLPGRKGNKPGITLLYPDWSAPLWTRLKLASGGGLIFTTRSGGLLSETTLLHAIKAAFTAIGYDWVRSHHLRKTVAAVLAEDGHSDQDVANQLGNSKKIARAHYIPTANANPRAAESLGSMFS